MLKVLIAGCKEECQAIFKNISWNKLDCKVVGMAYSGEDAYKKAVGENIDSIICIFDSREDGLLNLLNKLRDYSTAIQIILCLNREEIPKIENKMENIDYILKPVREEYNHISDLLKKWKDYKSRIKYLEFILTEKKFEKTVTKNLLRNNKDYFSEIFNSLSSADDVLLVKFACIKLVNIAYDYFNSIGVKRVKGQKDLRIEKISELKNVSEVVEKTKQQYMNLLQFGTKKDEDLYVSLIENIKHYIDRNYKNSALCVSGISKLFHFSPNYLNDVFKAHTGISIPKYILSVRMSKAGKLLIQTELQIREIALSVGYEKANYFPRLFKSYFKMSPLDYRKQYRKSNS